MNEESWILIGKRRGDAIAVRRVRHSMGQPASVKADAAWAFRREERRRDVTGFFHSHPIGCSVNPSSTDVETMTMWTSCFGKPLLCAITNYRDTAFWFFRKDGSVVEMRWVSLFPNLFVILGVKHG